MKSKKKRKKTDFKKLLYANEPYPSLHDKKMKMYRIVVNIILLSIMVVVLLFSFRHQGVRDYPAGL